LGFTITRSSGFQLLNYQITHLPNFAEITHLPNQRIFLSRLWQFSASPRLRGEILLVVVFDKE
jgi:hypothetical protein